MSVGNRTPDPSPLHGDYPFMYQRRILDAACADPNTDSEEEIIKKIQKMWLKAGDGVSCFDSVFSVWGGSVIKFAVLIQFDEFIGGLAGWKIDFNRVDTDDDRTVLDYISSEIKKFKGTAIEPRLKLYYSQIRNAGGKHKAELKDK